MNNIKQEFEREALVLGEDAVIKLNNSSVALFGVGGVGSYAAEALEAMVELAFEGLNLHRLEASIMPRNAASLALAKRCGFSEEGRSPRYIRINGVWEDHIHMVRLNEEGE